MTKKHPPWIAIAKSKITQYIDPLCRTFKNAVLGERRCNNDVIEEVIDQADEIERTPTIRKYEEEILEFYLEQANRKNLCSADGTPVKNACEAMEGVCNLGADIIRCDEGRCSLSSKNTRVQMGPNSIPGQG